MDVRVRVVAALVDGNSIRATARMVGVNRETVASVGLRVGQGCHRLHNRIVRDVAAYLLAGDETWSFCAKKQARVKETDPAEWGDLYTFVALDSTTKLAVSYLTGKRDAETTDAFIRDLRARLSVEPHFSTDGWQPYIPAVTEHFGGAVDYGQVVKNYRTGARRGPDHRYEPPRDPFITKTPISGAPVDELMNTSHVERFNLTLRHTVGRTRRLCLAFSKKLTHHRAAVALGVAPYNFVRVHGTIGTTPTAAAGLTERPWTLTELVTAALAEPETEAPRTKPLAPRPGAAAPVRQISTGRVLRLVSGAHPAPAVEGPPVAHAPPATPREPVQLGLFDPRPEPPRPWRPMEQLPLFDDV
jgi:IS1 family transposase